MGSGLGIDIGGTSVKVAVLDAGIGHRATQPHDGTAKGVASALAAAVAQANIQSTAASPTSRLTGGPPGLFVGVCLPGLYDPKRDCLTRAVNLPGLVSVPIKPLLAAAGVPLTGNASHPAHPTYPTVRIYSDALAAGIDDHRERKLTGRLLAVSLGTGVGAIVLDGLTPLKVSPPDAPLSSGHIGQFDVSLSSDAPTVPIGPDGGRGSLEAYIGAPALRERLGDLHEALPKLTADDPAIRALVRALRIAHAIYRPDHVSLLGGVGLGIAHLAPAIHAAVSDQLTGLARPHWTLAAARHAFHACNGAARLALIQSQSAYS